jgi:hypothetical protein
MIPYLPDVSEGQRPSAEWSNAVKDTACREFGGAAYSDDRQTIVANYVNDPLDLYQLTGAPEFDNNEREYKASAKPCKRRWCAIDGDGYVTGNSTPGVGAVRWVISEMIQTQTIWFPSGHRDANGEPLSAPTVNTGDRVWVTSVYGKLQVVANPRTIVPFMLKTSLTPASTATAYFTTAAGAIIDEEWTFTVTDTIGDKRAVGKDDAGEGNDGALGLAEVLGDGTVAIQWVHQRAKRCSAALTANAGPGATVNVDNVVPLDGGMSPVTSSSATLSCTMPPAARALDNATCVIEWDETNDVWKIVQVHEQARSLRGTLSGAMVVGGGSKAITSPVSCDGGQVPSGTVTGYNVFGWEGDSGGECWALWNEATDHYEYVQVKCPAA